MNSLKIPLRLDQLETIGKELERLFILQDRPLAENKKSMFLSELSDAGFPFGAIVSGIRALADKDLKTLKLFIIKESILKFISFDREKTNCPYCRGTGIISMMCDDGYSFSFACRCVAGQCVDKEFVKWNGEIVQELNGKKYTVADAYLLGDGYGKWIESCGIVTGKPGEMSWN